MIRRANRFHGHRAVGNVRGSLLHSRNFSVRYQKNKKSDYRLAVVVSKKTSPRAIVRNRIRRRIFEQIRSQGRLVSTPVDILIYVKNNEVAEQETAQLSNELADLTKKVLSQLR